MKKGILIYDSSTNRFDILYEEGNSYGGLHCGTTMESCKQKSIAEMKKVPQNLRDQKRV